MGARRDRQPADRVHAGWRAVGVRSSPYRCRWATSPRSGRRAERRLLLERRRHQRLGSQSRIELRCRSTVPSVGPPPGAPTGLTVSVTGNTAVFTFAPPASGGAVANFVLLGGLTPGFAAPVASLPLAPTQTSVAIPGVPPGTWFARVVAQNAAGVSLPDQRGVVHRRRAGTARSADAEPGSRRRQHRVAVVGRLERAARPRRTRSSPRPRPAARRS